MRRVRKNGVPIVQTPAAEAPTEDRSNWVVCPTQTSMLHQEVKVNPEFCKEYCHTSCILPVTEPADTSVEENAVTKTEVQGTNAFSYTLCPHPEISGYEYVDSDKCSLCDESCRSNIGVNDALAQTLTSEIVTISPLEKAVKDFIAKHPIECGAILLEAGEAHIVRQFLTYVYVSTPERDAVLFEADARSDAPRSLDEWREYPNSIDWEDFIVAVEHTDMADRLKVILLAEKKKFEAKGLTVQQLTDWLKGNWPSMLRNKDLLVYTLEDEFDQLPAKCIADNMVSLYVISHLISNLVNVEEKGDGHVK